MWVGSWDNLDTINASQGGNALMCGEEGTLYAIDVHNGLGWRSTDPRLETIHLGEEPLWEPLGDGLGWPGAIGNAKVLSDLEVVTGTNILFAIGRDGANVPTIWTYHDTLTSSLGPLDLIRPADEDTGVGTLAADKTQACLSLQWEPATDATQYEWEIGTSPELKVDGGFKSLWAHYAFLGQAASLDTQRFTNGEALPGCLPPGETYYWHVRVVQPFQSPWSEIWSFTTLYTSASEKPMPISPTGGIVIDSLKPSLQWLGAMDADKYELVVALECNWGSPIIEKSGENALGAETAYQITQNLQYGKNYCWKVKAIKGATESVWSDTATFTTMAQPAEVVEEGTPYWVWVVIGVSALMLAAVVVLIVLTKKA
jgi:hypothetical protein